MSLLPDWDCAAAAAAADLLPDPFADVAGFLIDVHAVFCACF